MLPEKRRARASGGEIAYVDAGAGPALLLLHGFPTSSFLWREYVHLFEPWFRVIVPDLLGHGDSEKPADAPLHIRAQAGYVRELLDRLGIERFAVIGHSTGGGIAQLLALDGGVDAMVLLNSIAFDEWPSAPVRDLQALRPEQQRPEIVRAVMATSFDLGMGHRSRLTDAMLEEYRRPWEGEEGTRAFFRAAHASDGLGLADRGEELGRLECPVFIMWGEDDPFLPALVAERLQELIATSSLAFLPGCSHFVLEDATDTVGPMILEWLRSRYLGVSHHHDAGPVVVQVERRTSEEGS